MIKLAKIIIEDIDIDLSDTFAGTLEQIKQNIDDIQTIFGDKYTDLHVTVEYDYDGNRYNLLGTRIETEQETLRRLKNEDDIRQHSLNKLRAEKERILAKQKEIEENMKKLES